jgi:CO dehydrogenase maturation factor
MTLTTAPKGLKVGFTGKGGVGKTFIASTLARLAARTGRFKSVLAIDNDPSLNLGQALGIPADQLGLPILDMKDLIKERTGRAPGESGAFKLNPKVNDIPEKFAVEGLDGVKLLVIGTIKDAGSGCMCSSNALVRELLYHMVVQRDELVVIDFEAGVESSMGRATAKGLDVLFIVTEPGQKAVDVALRLADLATHLGIRNIFFIFNKVETEAQDAFLRAQLDLPGTEIFGRVPRSIAVADADMEGKPLLDVNQDDPSIQAIETILQDILDRFYVQS